MLTHDLCYALRCIARDTTNRIRGHHFSDFHKHPPDWDLLSLPKPLRSMGGVSISYLRCDFEGDREVDFWHSVSEFEGGLAAVFYYYKYLSCDGQGEASYYMW